MSSSALHRALTAGLFGAGLAFVTGSTPIGIAIVAALGVGVAVAAGRSNQQDER